MYAVLLQEKDGSRNLPIIVGSSEAQAIALYLEGVDMPRPMTHDLLINVLETLETEINQVTIARMKNGTFFAEIKVSNYQVGEIVIDSRPSDALAVALRMHSPILVADDVMDEALILESDTETIEGEINQEPEVQLLERQLQKAIDKEEYEMAARIRDKIKEIDT